MNRFPYIDDERARQSNEIVQGAIIAAIVAVVGLAFVVGWLWLRDNAY